MGHQRQEDDVKTSFAACTSMVYSQSFEPDALPTCVLDLPEHILINTFRYLNEISLCRAAQACRLFLRLAGMHRLQQIPCLVDVYLP